MDNHTLVTGDNFYWNNIKKCQPILELHKRECQLALCNAFAPPLSRLCAAYVTAL
jgi:hypothetical protein